MLSSANPRSDTGSNVAEASSWEANPTCGETASNGKLNDG